MSFRKTLLIAAFGILTGITLLHGALNLGWFAPRTASAGGVERNNFRVGFLPVTCHLTCPVTDFINKQTTGGSNFDPVRFTAGRS
jgi:NitT/TauT family transport system substrate-binding protein